MVNYMTFYTREEKKNSLESPKIIMAEIKL